MDFEDHEEEDEDADDQVDKITLPGPYNTLGNSSSRVKMSNSASESTALALPSPRKPRYRECLKNHAVGIAGHAVDGCGEFMPSGTEGTLDALKCAACNCHRSFHRKETDVSTGSELLYLTNQQQQQQQHFSPYYRTPAGYLHVAPHHRPLALPSTSGEGRRTHSRDEDEDMSNPSGGGGGMVMTGGSSSKKRFRTKFTSEQKEKMMELAERLGWRLQKHDEAVVQQFCNDTGVKRHVLKVWMHNNKHTIGKKPVDAA